MWSSEGAAEQNSRLKGSAALSGLPTLGTTNPGVPLRYTPGYLLPRLQRSNKDYANSRSCCLGTEAILFYFIEEQMTGANGLAYDDVDPLCLGLMKK